MADRTIYRDSVFELSVGKYLYSKDVYFIHNAIKPKKPINVFEESKKYVKTDGDIISFSFPIREPEEGEEIDPNPFGSWLIDQVKIEMDNEKMQDFWAYNEKKL